MEEEIICKKCGKCCYHATEEGWKPCKYLRITCKGITHCTVYNTRLGRLIYISKNKAFQSTMCGMRKNTTHDFKGCPYNTNKPIIF
jgi:uncharacterized cysteine cluster protein YcgN (CxxCxxCC family)